LLAEAAINHLFYTPVFLESWWQTLGQGQLCLVSWREQATDRLVGVLPLFIFVNDRHQRQLGFVGCKDVSDYLDMVIAPSHRQAVISSLAEVLTNQLPDWDQLILCSIPERSATLTELTRMGQDQGWSVHRVQQDVCPVITLPDSWDGYLNSLKRKQRHEIRRKWRRLNQVEHQFRLVRSPAELETNLETFIRLHQTSSAEKKRFWDDHHLAFFKLTTQRVAEHGWLKLYLLDVVGEPAAAMLVFDYHHQFFLYNSGFAPGKFAQLSAGNLLTVYTIKQAIELGRRRYDFLRGDEPYKLQLGGVPEPVCDLTISRSRQG